MFLQKRLADCLSAERLCEESSFMQAWLRYDSDYTIFDSMRDSVHFAVERTLIPYKSHLCAKSSFVIPNGRIMHWHEFGDIEGPGWAANAVGGAYEIYCYGDYVADHEFIHKALLLLDHVLEDGFVNDDTGFVIGYRDTRTDKFWLNYKRNNDWFCAGSMAKIGFQMLMFADLLAGRSSGGMGIVPMTSQGQDKGARSSHGQDARAIKMRDVATKMASWIHSNIRPLPNGWYPKRSRSDCQPYRKHPWGLNDPVFDQSGDGLFIIQLMTALTERGLADYREEIRRRIEVFMARGGIFGSINHDTKDQNENVAYAVGFRVLRAAARLVGDEKIRRFAYEKCLAGLDQFKMHEDRNGCATKGLLFMEKSWDTAYMWENAEAALAYVEAYEETGRESFRDEAFILLQAISKHHHGPYGFLTEGVDWNNAVKLRKHHFWHAKYGDIRYTEPLLNNLHITEPTLHLLRLWPEMRI